jgi:hypothetical protein
MRSEWKSWIQNRTCESSHSSEGGEGVQSYLELKVSFLGFALALCCTTSCHD